MSKFWAGFTKQAEEKHEGNAGHAIGYGMGGAALGGLMAAPMVVPIGMAPGDVKENRKFVSRMKKHHKLDVRMIDEPKSFSGRINSRYAPPLGDKGGVHSKPKAVGARHSVGDTWDETMKRLEGDHKKRTERWNRMFSRMGIGGRAPRHGRVFTSPDSNLAIQAHELGHAIDFTQAKLHPKTRLAMRSFGPLAGLSAGATLAASDNEKAQKAAPWVAAAGSLPMLSQEAKATFHGTKEIARQLGKKRALKSLLVTGPAFGTYLALPTGTALGIRQYVKSREKKKKHEEK